MQGCFVKRQSDSPVKFSAGVFINSFYETVSIINYNTFYYVTAHVPVNIPEKSIKLL